MVHKMNKIYIPTTKPEDWKPLLADPKHWRSGYSAMALAYCWQDANGFPATVKRVFNKSKIKLFNNLDMLFAMPEYSVALPGGVRPSQNDLFILAKNGDHLITITVEGKVNEPFGPLVSDWFKNPSPGKKKRLAFICDKLGLEQSKIFNIRYQLLHRTVSAIIEAERFNTPNAMMLVHSFSQTNGWFNDYSDFAALFGIDAELDRIYPAGDIGGINLYLGWVKGEEKYLLI